MIEHLNSTFKVQFTLTGSYKFEYAYFEQIQYISGIQVNNTTPGVESFTLSCQPSNDTESWYLKVKNKDLVITHQAALSVTVADTNPQTITEIGIGQRTVNVVYNTYKWFNKDQSRLESY